MWSFIKELGEELQKSHGPSQVVTEKVRWVHFTQVLTLANYVGTVPLENINSSKCCEEMLLPQCPSLDPLKQKKGTLQLN